MPKIGRWPGRAARAMLCIAVSGWAMRCVSAATTTLVSAAYPLCQEPPPNPYLAASPWPMSHRHPYNQGSSPYPGPVAMEGAQPDFLEVDPVPITLAISGPYPDGSRVTWAATTKRIVKLQTDGPRLRLLADLPREQSREDAISGAYSLVDREGVFFAPRGTRIEAFRDARPGDPASPILRCRTFQLPPSLLVSDDDLIVGLNLSFDGRILFVTRRGLVGSLTRQLDDLEVLRLEDGPSAISNSMAVDEEGGIFVVTDRAVCRVQWTPTGAAERLRLAWSCPYETSATRSVGRLGTGSGTTPSLMGNRGQDQFVVICDGRELMHLLLIWRGDIPADWKGLPGRPRRIAAEVPVTFGAPGATASTTEQSATVRGYDVCLVSNRYGELGPWLRKLVRRRLGDDVHAVTIYRSNIPEVAPQGVEKFAWDAGRRQLRSVWTNQLSCPNGIPTMSEATGLLYFIGQRSGSWTLEAVNWQTGASVFHRLMSNASRLNSYYAATEIGSHGRIMTGTFGGVVRLGSDPPGQLGAAQQ